MTNGAITFDSDLVNCPMQFSLGDIVNGRGTVLASRDVTGIIRLDPAAGVVSITNYHALDYANWNHTIIKIIIGSENFDDLPAKALVELEFVDVPCPKFPIQFRNAVQATPI